MPHNVSKRFAVLLGSLGLIGGIAGTVALQTHAADTSTIGISRTMNNLDKAMMGHGTPPAAAGAVTAISGTMLTVTDNRTGTVYSVEAGSATVKKFSDSASTSSSTAPPAPSSISVSDIKVGDMVRVQGTVSGNAIAAASIIDGKMGFGGRGFHGATGAAGTISAVNGNTVTLTGKNGTTYTVDVSNATVKKVSAGTISDLKVGDTLMVSGAASGAAITATQVVDGEFLQKK